jgi:hypothetical protein
MGGMNEGDTGSMRAIYTDKLKKLIETGLDQGDHLSRIQAQGKLVIMEYFPDELEQAREWLNFLEALLLYGRAKDRQDQSGVKAGLFGLKKRTELGNALRQLEREIPRALADVHLAEGRARINKRRSET